MNLYLVEAGRIGVGLVFLLSVLVDYKSRLQLFNLMKMKNVPQPWFFFLGGTSWKILTSFALIFNFFTFWAALLLALYIFIANLIFNNFWTAPKERFDFSVCLFLMYLSVCFGLLTIAGVS